MTLAADPQTEFAPHEDAAKDERASTHRAAETILWLVPAVLLALVLAVKTWGLVALTMAALPLVPLMFAFFIAISLP